MQQSKAKCCRVVYCVDQARDHIALPKSMRCTVAEHAKEHATGQHGSAKEHALPLAMQTDASRKNKFTHLPCSRGSVVSPRVEVLTCFLV